MRAVWWVRSSGFYGKRYVFSDLCVRYGDCAVRGSTVNGMFLVIYACGVVGAQDRYSSVAGAVADARFGHCKK